mmetsp:Transcript_32305/g.57147  ORF Transcript_32305/g.57147 Transcript_32305/m.57147 type:complete len:241 (+) Transcript_32305:43-765(+)
MDPVTLHFNVFQAGSSGDNRTSFQVQDPRGTTVGALKKQFFSDALKESKSVRFIASGQILEDTAPLERFKLGSEAHIHVSISEHGANRSPSSSISESPGDATDFGSAKKGKAVDELLSYGAYILLGTLFFVGTGFGLHLAWRKRWQFSLGTSQLLFILAAVWAYLLLCHGLPALFQAICALTRATATPSQDTANVAVPSSGSSSATAACPDLSTMTPKLPDAGSGSAAAAFEGAALRERR